jgi:hypothetical protein
MSSAGKAEEKWREELINELKEYELKRQQVFAPVKPDEGLTQNKSPTDIRRPPTDER